MVEEICWAISGKCIVLIYYYNKDSLFFICIYIYEITEENTPITFHLFVHGLIIIVLKNLR